MGCAGEAGGAACKHLGAQSGLEVGEGPPQGSSQGQEDTREMDVGHAGSWGCHEKPPDKMATCMTKNLSY